VIEFGLGKPPRRIVPGRVSSRETAAILAGTLVVPAPASASAVERPDPVAAIEIELGLKVFEVEGEVQNVVCRECRAGLVSGSA